MILNIRPGAKSDIRKLPDPWQGRIVRAINALVGDPYPPNSIQMRKFERYRRLKIPPYRVIYRVGNAAVFVYRVEQRDSDTYRGFNPEEA